MMRKAAKRLLRELQGAVIPVVAMDYHMDRVEALRNLLAAQLGQVPLSTVRRQVLVDWQGDLIARANNPANAIIADQLYAEANVIRWAVRTYDDLWHITRGVAA